MNENLKPVEKLTPFTKMIMTIGTLPSSFYASMSYYESMVWLYEYLKNQIIPAVNNNAEAVEELQEKYIELKNYIDTYFDNLDVQEEINKKLDEMAEDGTLTNLIKGYVDPIIDEYENYLTGEFNDYKDQVNGAISDQNDEISEFKTSINSSVTTLTDRVNSATSGSPKGVYSTVSDLTTADPSHDYIYVVSADGKWYYYDTTLTAWTAGGDYQSSVIDPDDPTIYAKLDKQIAWTPEELTINEYLTSVTHQTFPAQPSVPYEGAVIPNFPAGTYKITCQSLNSSYIGCWIEQQGLGGLTLAGYTDHAQIYTDYEVTIPAEYNGGTLYINGRHDTAPVTIKDKSTQSSADFWEDYNLLKTTLENNVKNIKQLALRKYSNKIQIFKQGFKYQKDLCIELETKNPNGLFDFKNFYECNNTTNNVLNTLPELIDRTTINSGDTDYIAPSIIYAENDVDGDFADFTSGKFTGGWHGYNNGHGSGTPTASLVSASCYVDNIEVETNDYKEGQHATIILVQNLQASNTEKSNGSGREVMQQTITIDIDINDEKINVKSDIKALEDIIIVAHYGLSYYRTNSSNTCYFIGSHNIRDSWTYATDRLLADKNTLETIENISSVNDAIIMGRDPLYDLGTYYANNNTYGILLSSYKTYLQFVNYYNTTAENALHLSENDIVRWKAYYIIKAI